MSELRTTRLRLRQWRPEDREPFAALNADPEVMRHFPAPLNRAASDALAARAESLIAVRGWGLWAVEIIGGSRPEPPGQDPRPRPARQDHRPEPPRQDHRPEPPRQDHRPEPPRQDPGARWDSVGRRPRPHREGPGVSPASTTGSTDVRAGSFAGFIGLAVPSFEAHFTPAVEVGWRLARPFWGHGYATEGARAALGYAFDTLDLQEVVSFTAAANERSRRVMERLGMTRNPADDFDHPRLPGSPIERHVLYRLRAEGHHAEGRPPAATEASAHLRRR